MLVVFSPIFVADTKIIIGFNVVAPLNVSIFKTYRITLHFTQRIHFIFYPEKSL